MRPDADALKQALDARLAALNRSSAAKTENAQPDGAHRGSYSGVTFNHKDEAAAFVGALSRAASAPAAASVFDAPAQIWKSDGARGGVRLLLNDTAMRLTARVCAQLTVDERVDFNQMGDQSRLLFIAGQTAPMGLEEANALF